MFELLYIGKSALHANERQLQTVGQNIANVNTLGYSRQRVVQTNADPISDSFGSFGGGVEMVRIERMRDLQLDINYRDENSQLGSWSRMSQKLAELEVELNEPSEFGLSTTLNKFWDAWESLADNPADNVYRLDVLGAADNLSEAFHDINASLVQKRKEVNDEIEQIAGSVNSIASDLAMLNQRIQNSVGKPVNDLEDQFDLLLDDLSEYGNVRLAVRADGTRVVYFGSDELVKNDWCRNLRVVREAEDGDATSRLVWKDTRDDIGGLHQGKIVGLTRLRDDMIDGYRADLDALAVQIAASLNAIHRQGYDLGDPPSDGRNFFADDITGASDFRVSADILDQPSRIAASLEGEEGDNRIALSIADLRKAATMENGHSFGDYYGAWVGNIGRDSGNALNKATLHESTAFQIDNFRESVKGVSLDEEAAKLIQFQQSFAAAAKIISSADKALSIVISLV
ncbi:MAG: flagellar hook-associated protein FlgK [Candidatus Cloacimonetes bacterium]|nr:flagellar hook-associated protein FlgK [Candidatus Cloacimonadota bacterium]